MFKFVEKIENFSISIINRLENADINFQTWILGFLSIVFVRNFLETFSDHLSFFKTETYAFLFLHSVFFMAFVFLMFSICLHFITQEKIEKITKLSLFAAFLLLVPPILDIIASGGEGVKNSYLFVDQTQEIEIWQVIAYFVKSSAISVFPGYDLHPLSSSMNYGIRLEICILLLGILYYIFLKTKSGFRIIVAIPSMYLSLFIIYLVPYFLAKTTGTNIANNVSILNSNFSWNYVLFSCYLILTLIFGLIWFCLYNKEKFFVFLKNIRFFRTLQIVAIFFFGLYIADIANVKLNVFDYLVIGVACLSLIFYWISAILFNDLVDLKGDQINDPKRPLPSGKFTLAEIKTLAVFFLALSLLASFAVSYSLFLLIILRSCLGYLYSGKPFRLKKIPILSTFILALAAFTTVLGGYLMMPGNSALDFPAKIALLVLVAFTLGFNAKDIKDYAGDKVDKIYTLPVLLGLENGKKIIGVLSLLCFLLVPFLFRNEIAKLLPISIVAGLLSFFLIIKKNYHETPLFLLYFAYATAITLIIF